MAKVIEDPEAGVTDGSLTFNDTSFKIRFCPSRVGFTFTMTPYGTVTKDEGPAHLAGFLEIEP